MDFEENDDFAPGALFKRFGKEKNSSNAAKNENALNKNLDLPKKNGSKKNGSSNTGSIERHVANEIKKTAPGPSTSLVPQAESGEGTSGLQNKQPTSATIVRTLNSHALLVNPKQRGNPVLKSICNVTWEYSDSIAADYVMGATTCALFLSIRYHNLNPDYIHDRLKLLGNQYELRVLLVQVDSGDPHHALKHLTRICILANLTLVLAWSPEEAGRILEVYKSFEHKPPDLIMERKESNPHQKIVNALTSIRSVNKTDAGTLLSTFGSLESLLRSSRDSLGLCPGLGPQKANRLYNVLHQPFLKSATASKGTKRKSEG